MCVWFWIYDFFEVNLKVSREGGSWACTDGKGERFKDDMNTSLMNLPCLGGVETLAQSPPILSCQKLNMPPHWYKYVYTHYLQYHAQQSGGRKYAFKKPCSIFLVGPPKLKVLHSFVLDHYSILVPSIFILIYLVALLFSYVLCFLEVI